jgi:site-specific DNA recombinase
MNWARSYNRNRGGLAITKSRLHHLLTNVTYVGKIRYKEEVHEGEHEAIVDESVFERVQATLRSNGNSGCAEKRNKHGALLRGILRCASCKCGMAHTFTAKGRRRYRYYVCNNAQQNGRAACPAPSLPAAEIEQFVVQEIKAIGRDPALVAATLAESRRLAQDAIKRLKSERAALERQRRVDEAEVRKLMVAGAQNGELARLADVEERMSTADRRIREIESEVSQLVTNEVNEEQVATAIGEFDAVWAALAPKEQARVLALLIERIEHDGKSGNVAITFHPTGIQTLATQANDAEETAA